MTADQLSDAITNGQVSLATAQRVLHGPLVNLLRTMLDKYDNAKLESIWKLFESLSGTPADEFATAFDVFKADIVNAQQIDFAAISNAGEWLKNHYLVLRFVANHFTT